MPKSYSRSRIMHLWRIFFQAINKFESMVNQIKKNAEDIEQRLDMIRKTTLFKPCPPNQLGELPSCKVMLMPRSLCC